MTTSTVYNLIPTVTRSIQISDLTAIPQPGNMFSIQVVIKIVNILVVWVLPHRILYIAKCSHVDNKDTSHYSMEANKGK